MKIEESNVKSENLLTFSENTDGNARTRGQNKKRTWKMSNNASHALVMFVD